MSPRQTRIVELDTVRKQMNEEFKALPAGHSRRAELLHQIAAAGRELRRMRGRVIA